MRVTAKNVDEYISANIVVKPDRTLDVVVEPVRMFPRPSHHAHYLEQLPVPGAPLMPPQIPRDLRSPSPESYPSSPIPTRKEDFLRPDYTNLRNLDENHLDRSSSAPSPDHDASQHGVPRTPYKSTVAGETRVSSTDMATTRVGSSKQNRGYESPMSDEEPEELHETISKAMDVMMQKDCGWAEFFQAKAGPQRVSEVLRQYQFVQRMMNTWVGKSAPFRTCNHVVEAVSATGSVWARILIN